MFTELLQKLESEHGIAPAQGKGVLNTIVQHVKEKFPMVAGMIDNLLGSETAAGVNTTDLQNNSKGQNEIHNESTLEEIEDLARSKLGGLFGR